MQPQIGLRRGRGEGEGVVVDDTLIFVNDRRSSIRDREMVFESLRRLGQSQCKGDGKYNRMKKKEKKRNRKRKLT